MDGTEAYWRSYLETLPAGAPAWREGYEAFVEGMIHSMHDKAAANKPGIDHYAVPHLCCQGPPFPSFLDSGWHCNARAIRCLLRQHSC